MSAGCCDDLDADRTGILIDSRLRQNECEIFVGPFCSVSVSLFEGNANTIGRREEETRVVGRGEEEIAKVGAENIGVALSTVIRKRMKRQHAFLLTR